MNYLFFQKLVFLMGLLVHTPEAVYCNLKSKTVFVVHLTEQLEDSSEKLKTPSKLIPPLYILKLQHHIHLSNSLRNLLQAIKNLHILPAILNYCIF